MNVDGSDNNVGAGSENGGDNGAGGPDNGGVDNDVGLNDVDFSGPEEDTTTEAATDAAREAAKQAVDTVADKVEAATGVDIPEDVRAEIADKVAKEGIDKAAAAVASVVEKTLEKAGVPYAGEITKAIVDAIDNPNKSATDIAKDFVASLAKQGIAVMDLSPVAKSVVTGLLEAFTNPDYNMADLMGDIANMAVNVVGHSIVASFSLGSANIAAAVGIGKLGDMAENAMHDHIDQAIENGDVVNPGEQGYNVEHGPGHDKSETPILLV